jgi:predicted metallopeptidase
LSPDKESKVVDHEMVHINQIKRGDLDYDNKNVYWKGKSYSRSSMKEGARNLPWEKEAYDKQKQ